MSCNCSDRNFLIFFKFFQKKNLPIYQRYIKKIYRKIKGTVVTSPDFFWEIFIYGFIMKKKFGDVQTVPLLDILIYIFRYIFYKSIYRGKGEELCSKFFFP